MPARKPSLQEMPHFPAVMMAPESPLKQQVVDHANRIMASRMQLLEDSLALSHISIRRATAYINAIVDRPPESPDAQTRRDPHMVSLSQANRAQARLSATMRDIERLREASYQEAREAAYRRTLTRVGPRYWPSEDPDLHPQGEAQESPEVPATLPAPATAPPELAAPEIAEPAPQETPAPTPSAIDYESMPMSNRFYEFGQELMTRYGIPKHRQAQLNRQCKTEQWKLGQYKREIQKLEQEMKK
ncbi:MAG: hypothetical protein KF754_03590 [Planctomycetes bacterium]|nr:hypothetical protein [Planctomycetota bacterium]